MRLIANGKDAQRNQGYYFGNRDPGMVYKHTLIYYSAHGKMMIK
jgi:hypothetical protein